MTLKRIIQDSENNSKIQKVKRDLDENQNNLFIDKLINNRIIETCLNSFITHLDLCILRMTCKRLSILSKKKAFRKKQFQIGSLSIRYGYFVLFSWIYENVFPQLNSSENLTTFAHSKRDEEEQIKLIESLEDYHKIVKDSQITGNLEILKWAYKKVGSLESHGKKALKNGHLHILKWLEENGCIPSEKDLYVISLDKGYEDIFEWAKEIYPKPSHFMVANKVALLGRIEFLNQIKDGISEFQHSSWENDLCYYYATIGDLKSLENLICSMKSEFQPTYIGSGAAKYGHLIIIEWIIKNYKNRIFFWGSIAKNAADGGQLKILQWIFNNVEIDQLTSSDKQDCQKFAAKNCHWEVVKWLCDFRGFKFPLWDYMAKNGDLELMKWAKENNMDGGHKYLEILIKEGHFEIIQWIIEISTYKRNESILSIIHSQFEITKLFRLKRLGDWDESLILKAIEIGNSRILSWLIEEKCPGFKKYKKLLKI